MPHLKPTVFKSLAARGFLFTALPASAAVKVFDVTPADFAAASSIHK